MTINIEHVKEVDFCKLISGRNGLRILSLNINGMANKFSLFELFIEDLRHQKAQPDVIFLSETKIRESHFLDAYNLNGFKAIHSLRPGVRGGGGIMFYIRDNLRFSSNIKILNCNEIQFLVVKLENPNLTLCGCYRPPTSIFSNLNDFYDLYDKILLESKNLISCGDFNINLLNTNDSFQLRNILNLNHSFILNKIEEEFFTRYQSFQNNHSSKTIIDHFHTNLEGQYNFTLFVGESSLSDHNFLLLTVSVNQTSVNTSKIIKKTTNFKNVSIKLRESLKNVAFKDFDEFHNTLNRLLVEETNTIGKNYSNKNPWFNQKLRVLWNDKVYYSKIKKKFPDNVYFKEKYQQLAKTLLFEIRAAKRDYYSKLFPHLSNSKKTWATINEMLGKRSKLSNINLRVDGNIIKDPQIIANSLNEFFVNVSKSVIPKNHDPLHFEFDTWEGHNEQLNVFETVSEDYVGNIIKSLKNDVAMGVDDVSVRFVKLNAQILIPHLTSFINKAFSDAIFPHSLKIARVSPIYKSHDAHDPTNYRPISVLSVFSKIFEICMKEQLIKYLNTTKTIHLRQYGFLPNSSTSAAASCLANDIFSSLNKFKKTAVLTLDIKKAFDCVSHAKLNEILMNVGITNKALKLLECYFTSRQQTVCLGLVKSKLLNIIAGCPQGSVLGPLIFLIYINGLLRLKLNGKIRLFADDAALIYSATDYDELQRIMTQDLQNIEEFLSTICLSLNYQKTNFVVFRLRSNTEDPFREITCFGEKIFRVEQFKYLGVIFDQFLTWRPHVEKILKHITPYISILKKIRHYLTKSALMSFYYAHIHSRLIYCLPVWQNMCQDLKNGLQRAQNKAIKLIAFLPPLTPTNELYDEKLLKFTDQLKYENILFIYKISSGLMRCDVKLGTNFEKTNRLTRQSHLLCKPGFLTVKAQSSIFYKGIVDFNNFLKYLKDTNKEMPGSLGSLKSLLREFVRRP